MNEFLSFISSDKRSLARGFLVVFALVLPFVLLPFLIRQGVSLETFRYHLPQSGLYAALIAIAIIALLVLRNYQKLLHKKRLYSFPAFAQLQFRAAVEGYNAIVKELSTFLFGKVGDYYFRVNLILSSGGNVGVELSPLIHIGQDEELLNELMQNLHLEERLYLSRVLWLTEEQLKDPGILQPELERLAVALHQRGVAPMAAHDYQV